jgi:beta-galactosidase/beta-glucuronidase
MREGQFTAAAKSMIYRTTTITNFHEQLLLDAGDRIDKQEYRLAVVLAQAACEVLTDQVLNQLIETVQPDALRSVLRRRHGRTADLDDDRLRELYEALSGDRIGHAPFWQSYTQHVKRRHQVVHAGVDVSRDDALASCDTVRKLVDHLVAVRRRIR